MLGVQRTFEELGAPLHTVPFVVLDLETTGTSPGSDAITEIGAVRYLGGELTGTFHTLVDPGPRRPAADHRAHRHHHGDGDRRPPGGGGAPLAARVHRGRGDGRPQRPLRQGLPRRRRRPTRLRRRCPTAPPTRAPSPDACSPRRCATTAWRTLAMHLRSPVTPTHRALDDARATAHVFFELLGRAGSIGVTYLEDLIRLPTARGAPHYSKLRLTDRLPRRPGVYLFRNGAGEVIYVGKAKELRSRVRSYFYGDRRRRITQMMRELTAVDHVVCASEIDAVGHRDPAHRPPRPPLQPPVPTHRQRPLGAAHRRAVPPAVGGAQSAGPGAGPPRPVPPQVDRRAGGDRDLGRHADSSLHRHQGRPPVPVRPARRVGLPVRRLRRPRRVRHRRRTGAPWHHRRAASYCSTRCWNGCGHWRRRSDSRRRPTSATATGRWRAPSTPDRRGGRSPTPVWSGPRTPPAMPSPSTGDGW